MRAVTILICVVVMVAVVCAQQQQQRTGKQDKNVVQKHQKTETVDKHGKQDIKATKNGKSKSNIKAEWTTETLVVEVSPSQKSHKKASTKVDVPIVDKHASGKNHARPSVGKAATFAPKKQNKVDAKNVVAQQEEIVEEIEEVVLPKKQQKVVKLVKSAKTSVTKTKKEKPCPCSAAKMEEIIEEDIDETIDEDVETPCAAAKAKTVKKVKTQPYRKVVEEEASTETLCSKKAKNNCAGATMSKKVKSSTKSVSVSTKPIKQCPLDEMTQCAKGWEHDAVTGECKPSTGCAIKKEKALKKIGIRLPATHSVTVKQDENNSEDFTVNIVSNDAKDGEEQQFIVTDSDDTENVSNEDDESCEMCTQY